MKVLIISLILLSILQNLNSQAVITKNYPIFKQCDSDWGGQIMGANGATICNYGCFMTDLAMILNYYGIPVNGQSANPSNLNQFLQTNGGYNVDSQFQFEVLPSISQRLNYGGQLGYESWDTIKQILNNPNENLIAWVDNQTHYVLVTGYDATNPSIVYVHDPYYQYTYYEGAGIDGWVLISVSGSNKFLEK